MVRESIDHVVAEPIDHVVAEPKRKLEVGEGCVMIVQESVR
jgi:hypothetical protein